MSHHCHATNCNTNVPPEMFMCKRHWFMLPKSMRDAIWRTYCLGQCDDWNISNEYANAVREAVIPDTSIYAMLDPGDKSE